MGNHCLDDAIISIRKLEQQANLLIFYYTLPIRVLVHLQTRFSAHILYNYSLCEFKAKEYINLTWANFEIEQKLLRISAIVFLSLFHDWESHLANSKHIKLEAERSIHNNSIHSHNSLDVYNIPLFRLYLLVKQGKISILVDSDGVNCNVCSHLRISIAAIVV